jgi:hypothetical protein
MNQGSALNLDVDDGRVNNPFVSGTDFVGMVADLTRLTTGEGEVRMVLGQSRMSDAMRPLEPNTEWLLRFIRHAQHELGEMEELVPLKWWSTQTGSVERLRAELVDVLHFLFSAAWVLGMSWDDLAEVFRRKFDVNYTRSAMGVYDGTNRGDDLGVGDIQGAGELEASSGGAAPHSGDDD